MHPIFRIINGEKVKIAERDPNRRYSAVNGPEGLHYVEFTEEEEKRKDQEEADWKEKQRKKIQDQIRDLENRLVNLDK